MTRTFAAAAVLVAACLGAGAARGVSPALLGGAYEERLVRDLLAGQMRAWNGHDAQAWAAAFARDADFTSALGFRW